MDNSWRNETRWGTDLPTYYAARVVDYPSYVEQNNRWIDDMAYHAIAPRPCF